MTEQIIKQNVPNAIACLVLGICSLVFGCFFVGFICGIIGLVLGNKGKQEYLKNPDLYTGYGMISAGRIMSIIGIVLGAIYILYSIIAVAIVGSAGLAWFSLFEEFI